MKSGNHYTEDELADYAFDPAAYAARAELEAHLAECAECSDQLSLIEALDGALRDPIGWKISDDLRAESSPVPEALQRRASTISEEDAAARALLAPLLVSPSRFEHAHIEADNRFHTTGAVAALYQSVKEVVERQPQFAFLIANAAVVIAVKLARAHALRAKLHLSRAHVERARALFFLGRYKDAEESLDRAERVCEEDEQSTDWDLASAWLLRANICVESERMSEGRQLAMAAARKFRIFGDTASYLKARLLLASAMFMEGDYQSSADAADEIVTLARERQDTLLLGRALQNSAEAYLMLREYEKAWPRYLEAHAVWDELGFEVERIRTDWSLATLETETGNIEAGIQRLIETYRAFEALGVVNDAALARMQVAETLLRAGRPETVPDLLRDVVVTFASEGMMRNAGIALAHLKDAIEQERLSADLVYHVRTYIEHLPFRPNARFAPLA